MAAKIPSFRTFRGWLAFRALPKGRGWRIHVRRPKANIIQVYRAYSCSKEEAAKAIFEPWKARLLETQEVQS